MFIMRATLKYTQKVLNITIEIQFKGVFFPVKYLMQKNDTGFNK